MKAAIYLLLSVMGGLVLEQLELVYARICVGLPLLGGFAWVAIKHCSALRMPDACLQPLIIISCISELGVSVKC